MSALTAYWEGHISPQECAKLLKPDGAEPARKRAIDRAWNKGFKSGVVLAIIGMTIGIGTLLWPDGAFAAQPNVLVVMTDDQRSDDLEGMPQTIERIRDQGVDYQNSYASDPNCCPSRTSFITGQYAHNHGVVSSGKANPGYLALDQDNALGSWMQSAGYLTGFTGKYLNPWAQLTPNDQPPGWDSWTGILDPVHQMWDFDINEDGAILHFPPPVYKEDVLGLRARDFLAQGIADPRPFFLWYAPPAPHRSGKLAARPEAGVCADLAQPAESDLGTFADEPLPPRPDYMEPDVSDKNPNIQDRTIRPAGYGRREAVARECRLESLLSVDRDTAAMLDQIDAAGELDNTLVIFTSDNGFFYGEHRVPGGKLLVYGPSTRVPLYISGPGYPVGAQSDTPVTNVDLAPTITAAAEATMGRAADGTDLASLPLNANRHVLLEKPLLKGGEPGDPGGGPRYSAAVGKRWELIDYYDISFQEFYDLRDDPFQLDGTVSADEAPHVAVMQSKLKRLSKCAGVTCAVDR